jgi:hypothetical protein
LQDQTQVIGQVACNFAKVFQLVFQPKIKVRIKLINQDDSYPIQITPAHHIQQYKKAPRVEQVLFLWLFGLFWLRNDS